MKAILVINMPDSCLNCPLRLWDLESQFYNACIPTLKEKNSVTDEYEECDDILTRPNWCPLKPMPEPRSETVGDKPDPEAHGWNLCLEEILGETE